MGGAADLPQRSSSPLKRRASDLEDRSGQNEDVDMDSAPTSENVETTAMSGISNGIRDSQEEQERTPSIDEQIAVVWKMVEAFQSEPLVPGAKAYLISKKWINRVQSRGSNAKVEVEDDEEIGPIDNGDIMQEIIQDYSNRWFARLKFDLPSDSYYYFPEDAYDYVLKLYGLKAGHVAIDRYAVNTNPDPNGAPNVQFEIHPPVFSIYRLWGAHSPLPVPQILKAKKPAPPIFVVSRGDRYMEFLRQIKKAVMIEPSQKVRVWRVPEEVEQTAAPVDEASPAPSRETTPASEGPRSWKQVLLDVKTFTQLEKGTQRELVDVQDQTNNPNYNGHVTIGMAGLGVNDSLVIDEHVEGPDYLSQYVPKSSKLNAPRNGTSTALTKVGNESGRNSPVPTGPVTRGRTQKSTKPIGTVGLNNLGNTCYMNSALQCIRSIPELTKYFLAGEAQKELNPDNPLGNNGEVALVYSALLDDFYRDPPLSSFAPRQFKNTIGRYAPSFSGYGQQDSQEFLGFLLDGLQEDLSRVKKKPYIEKPDSTDDMIGNPQAIREMAEKVWDITKARDDSVIADLFTGMYKSTLVCPVCAKVSITFDPFNNLTLQLPIENTWSHDIAFFPLNDKPVIISVELDKQSSVKSLKEFIGSRTGVPADKLFIAEEFKGRFFKYFDDLKPVSEEIQTNDQIYAYELESVPTNWPSPKKPAKKQRSMLSFSHYNDPEDDEIPSWDDPMANRMLVPVMQRHPNPKAHGRFAKAWNHGPVPLFIVLTPEEARSEDIIRRKVLEKIVTFTTLPLTDDDSEEELDSDIVITNASDADSSGDSKINANSVDGEEDVVDVTMKESTTTKEADGPTTNSNVKANGEEEKPRKQRFRTRRPKWIDPHEFLPAGFQNMFELGYFTGGKELVPTGWSIVDEERTFPKLSSRDLHISQDEIEDEDEAQDDLMINDQAKSETESSEDEVDMPPPAQTRMNEESSEDEDDDLAPRDTRQTSRALPVRPIGHRSGVRVGYTRRRNRGIKTYSRKGMKPSQQPSAFGHSNEDSSDDGPLIRLGEGIVVDWESNAFETLFDGRPDDNMRGEATWTKCEVLSDPELAAKRKARINRRKQGLTLDECLDEFGKEEILSEMDTWYCPRCKEHRRASKKFELWKTPDILIIHLKRFSSSSTRRDKLEVMVNFPIEGLDLTTRVVDHQDGKQEIFDLFAVDLHWGGLGGGHYTAFAKSFIDNEWYEYNDSSVSKKKDTTELVSRAAYLLFYRRRSDEPLGGPRLKEIVNRYDNPPEPEISEDESVESGEDQRLDAGSSLHGSSSALIGVGAAHLPGHGSGNGQTTRNSTAAVDPAILDSPPPYGEHLKQDDGAPLLGSDAIMNDGIEMNDVEDEGIDMGVGYHSLNNMTSNYSIPGTWNFSAIDSLGATGSSKMIDEDSVDGASDVVQHDSSASETSLEDRIRDFEHSEVEGGEWVEPSPVPDLAEEDQMDIYNFPSEGLTGTRRHGHGEEVVRELKVPAPDDDDAEAEEEAAEIHVEDGDELKMD